MIRFRTEFALGLCLLLTPGLAAAASDSSTSRSESRTEKFSYLGVQTTIRGGAVVVVEADKDGPAFGILRADDVLTRFNDTPVESPAQLDRLVRASREGSEAVLTYRRGNETRTAKIRLAERSHSASSSSATSR